MPAVSTPTPRILFHAPGLAVHRRTQGLPHVSGLQPAVMDSLQGLVPSHNLTGNRGNIVHAEAAARMFQRNADLSGYGNIGKLYGEFGDGFAETIAANFDLIVISLANFIRPNTDLSSLASALTALDGRVPFMVLGAGLQGKHEIGQISQGTRDAIAVINERGLVFGVRGEDTCAWLHKYGFTRAEVLGCPSLYVYPQSIMSLDATEALRKGDKADVMTAGHLSIRDGKITRRGIDLVKALKGIDASYVFQDEFLKYGDLKKTVGLFNDGNAELKASILNPWLSERCGKPINFRRYYYFNEAGAWRQGARRHDVFIGDRFHGGIAALQAGLPSIFLKEDNRVGELTSYFGLPALSTRQFASLGLKKTLDKMLSEEKLAAMKQTYRRRFRHFRKTMAAQGVTVISRLGEFGAEPSSQEASD